MEPGRSQSYGEEPDLSGLPGVHIECKRVERLNISQAMAQAVRDAEKFQDGAPHGVSPEEPGAVAGDHAAFGLAGHI